MKKLLVLLLISSGVLIYACKHQLPVLPPAPITGGGGTGGGSGSNLICFESEILPLFQTNCAKSGCHDASTHKDGYVLDSYSNLFKKENKTDNSNIRPFDPDHSKLYKVLYQTGSDRMPPPPNPDLTVTQKNLIARWITEGAQNTTNCVATCDSNSFKFAANILPIMQNHCTGCHSATNPPNGVNLTTYAGVKATATSGAAPGLLIGTTQQLPGFSKMPKGSGMLSACELAQIRKWVNAGSLNN